MFLFTPFYGSTIVVVSFGSNGFISIVVVSFQEVYHPIRTGASYPRCIFGIRLQD